MSGGAASVIAAPFASMLVVAIIFQQMCLVLPQSQKEKEAEYAKRPYKFQFNIEDHHHRKEEKNEKGIIMGEFGFVTADFFYLTTVYATDEEGKFRILARSRKYIGPPTEKPPTRTAVTTRRPPTTTGPSSPQGLKPALQPQKQVTPAKTPFTGLTGCSNCVVPTTTKRPPAGGIANNGQPFPGTGINQIGSPGIGGVIPPQRPGSFDQNPSIRPGNGRPSIGTKPGALGQSVPPKPGTQGQTPSKPGSQGPTTSFRPNQATPVQPGSISPAQGTKKVPPGSRPGLGGQNQQAGRPLGGGGSGLTKGDLGGPNYKFNYTVGFHGHHETGYRGGSKEGGYFANHRDGEGQRVVYEANEFGYQPNVTKVRLSEVETPKEETEKDYGLKGYEFKWFN